MSIELVLRCDVCRDATSPATKGAVAKVAAKVGWKAKGRHVCPKCHAKFLKSLGGDKVARARAAHDGLSGESIRDLAKEWEVAPQTPLNWISASQTE